MHVTQHQGGLCPEPRTTQPGASENHLAGLLTDPARFNAWIATAVLTTAQPQSTPEQTDADGYVVTDAGLLALTEAVPAEAPGTAGQVLRDAALYVERHGWIQGAYYDATSQTFTPAACMVGAIGMVCYGGPVEAPAQHFDDPGFLDFEEAVLHLDRYLLAEDGSESYEFNDARGRRAEDVTRVLRQAADTPAHELIDAIRAIDAKNADVAALAEQMIPSATWDDPVAGDDSDDDTNFVDCLFCGAPGGYPYCEGNFGGRMSCADAVRDDSDTTTGGAA
jgi:hypothetical protein